MILNRKNDVEPGSAPASGAVFRAFAANIGRAGMFRKFRAMSRVILPEARRVQPRSSRACSPAAVFGLKSLPVLLTLGLLVSGCAHVPVNSPLPTADSRAGYRFQNAAPQTNSDDLFLMLAFSGGGTRAAALSYSVLEELKKTEVGLPGNPHPLLEDVGLISSVSGGSFTAAYYALWGNRIFSDFEPQFLKKHVQTDLFLRVLAPWNMVRLASPSFSRSDLAAEYYDHLLFKGATFGDLMARRDRPFLCVNATDVASGARFEFTQDEFDLIRSDLSQFPVSHAVAASSALPPYLTPVTLKNYSAEQAEAEPEWIQSILDDPAASTRMRYVASQARSYVDGHRRFIHLVDGGFSDYLGLRGAIDRVIAREQSVQFPSVPLRIPRRVALIVVDSDRDFDYGWDSKEHPLGLRALRGSVGQVTVSHYSFETIELFKEVMARLSREHTGPGDSAPLEITTYVIELHFNQLSDESDRRFFNTVPTSLQLPSKTVDRLRQLATHQLADNVEFRRLVSDLRDQPIKPDSPARPSVAAAKGAMQMTNP
jgi:NTE family protein